LPAAAPSADMAALPPAPPGETPSGPTWRGAGCVAWREDHPELADAALGRAKRLRGWKSPEIHGKGFCLI